MGVEMTSGVTDSIGRHLNNGFSSLVVDGREFIRRHKVRELTNLVPSGVN